MLNRNILLAQRCVMKIPSRGKALQNWARPSINEMGVPTEPWSRVNDKNQKKFALHLVTGIGLFCFTALVAFSTVDTNSTPHHLLK